MKTLIIKFLTDSISEEELETLRNWLQDPKNQKDFNAIIRANQKLDFAYRPVDVEMAYRRVLKTASIEQKSIPKRYRKALKYAAVTAILISASVGLTLLNTDGANHTDRVTETDPQITLELEDGTLQILDENKRTTIVDKTGKAVVNQEYGKLKYENNTTTADELAYNLLTVPYGKRFNVELADGTVVFLNAGTKLRYPRAFTNPNSREVYLEGEALFNVKENTSHPFIVHTEKMNIRVLGTTFNVSSYKNESSTSTILVEGSVGVYRPSESFDEEKSIVISPRQQATIQEEEFAVSEVNVQKHIAWTEGKLYFVNDPFGSIIKELERHYDIKIENNYPELNHTRYTGSFESETIDRVLDTFKKNTEFNYLKEKDLISIESSL